MSSLYILSQATHSPSRFADKLSASDAILLRGDACYSWAMFNQLPVTVYALQHDMTARGCNSVNGKVILIDDNQWVELTLQFSKTVSE